MVEIQDCNVFLINKVTKKILDQFTCYYIKVITIVLKVSFISTNFSLILILIL